jgi:antitoxin (DNA-binding transcriptional repressor) of toxin-antitoxin stability system
MFMVAMIAIFGLTNRSVKLIKSICMATEVSILEAAKELPALIGRMQNGEEILISKDGHPVARLMPASEGDRVPGSAQGLFVVPDDFSAPLPDEFLDEFEK